MKTAASRLRRTRTGRSEDEIADAAVEGWVMWGNEGNRQQFSVSSEQLGHAAHLHMVGEIDLSTVPLVEGWLRAAESNGNTAIVVDLEHVTFMDASGLRAFLGAAERARGRGRTFAIVRAPAIVKRMIHITGTDYLLAAEMPASGSGPPSLARGKVRQLAR